MAIVCRFGERIATRVGALNPTVVHYIAWDPAQVFLPPLGPPTEPHAGPGPWAPTATFPATDPCQG